MENEAWGMGLSVWEYSLSAFHSHFESERERGSREKKDRDEDVAGAAIRRRAGLMNPSISIQFRRGFS